MRGTDLSQNLLHQGEVAEVIARAPVYLQLGAPGSVVITIAGKTLQLAAGQRRSRSPAGQTTRLT